MQIEFTVYFSVGIYQESALSGLASMGGGASKQTHVKERFTLPPEQVPYQGTILQYSFMNVNTHMTSHFSFNFSQGETMVTSNVDEYYPILAQNYKDGFKLEQFVKIPFAVSQTGFFSLTVAVPYQAVYCRKYINQQQTTSWQLKIEKSIIYMSRLGGGKLFSLRHEFSSTTSDLSHMYEIIQRNAAAGGRFVCMEQTGMVQSQGMSMAMAGVCPGIYSPTNNQIVFFLSDSSRLFFWGYRTKLWSKFILQCFYQLSLNQYK